MTLTPPSLRTARTRIQNPHRTHQAHGVHRHAPVTVQKTQKRQKYELSLKATWRDYSMEGEGTDDNTYTCCIYLDLKCFSTAMCEKQVKGA